MDTEINKAFTEIEERKLLTTGELKSIKNDILQKMMFDKNELKLYHKLLTNYRYIDEIDELRYGSYIRWFNLNKPKSLKLLNGGFIIDIKNNNGNIIILCKNALNRLFNLNMDKSIIFQKNTKQEALLIKILDHVQTIE
jgi:hypothetical protein